MLLRGLPDGRKRAVGQEHGRDGAMSMDELEYFPEPGMECGFAGPGKGYVIRPAVRLEPFFDFVQDASVGTYFPCHRLLRRSPNWQKTQSGCMSCEGSGRPPAIGRIGAKAPARTGNDDWPVSCEQFSGKMHT